MRLVPDHVEETVAIVKLPNYQERFQISAVNFENMKRFGHEVGLLPFLKPVHFKDTMVCFKNNTRKRFVSHTYYEPKLKPKLYSETLIIFPKRPVKTFVSGIDHHIDECRKWFKTSMEFTARTYTTRKIVRPSPVCNGEVHDSEPGASQVYLPRFNSFLDNLSQQEIENNIMPHERINGVHGLVNGGPILMNGDSELWNGDLSSDDDSR